MKLLFNTKMISSDEDPDCPEIEVDFEDELDGSSIATIILDLSTHLPIVAGSAAATLISINKAIDEMKVLVKHFLPAGQGEERAGLFENGQCVLKPNASESEIDSFFEEFRARAKSLDRSER